MAPHYAEIQKRANFTKEQCDVKYNSLISCIDLQLFHVSEKKWMKKNNTEFSKLEQKCPQTALTGKKGCVEAKQFMDDCNQDFIAMEKFAENQHQKESK